MDVMQAQAKALIAAAVSFAATYAAQRLGIQITPEIQASIVGLIMWAVVYYTPNKAA